MFPLRQPQIFGIISRAEPHHSLIWNNAKKAAREKPERSDWSLTNEAGPPIGWCFLSSQDAVGCCHGAARFQRGAILCVCIWDETDEQSVCARACVLNFQVIVSTVGLDAECESCLAVAASV